MIQISPTTWKNLPGPQDITRTVLPNGISVLSRSNFNSPSVVVQGYLAGGSMFDPRHKLGLAYFASSMLTRGTPSRTFQQIFDALESVGATISFSASVHNTNFGGRCLVEDLPLMLTLMADCLREPSFPEDNFERMRAQILAGLAIRAQDTTEMASLTFDEILYPDHPYGLPSDGYPETIQAITREDLFAFHLNNYTPRTLVVSLVGALSPTQVLDEIHAAFGDWQTAAEPPVGSMPNPADLQTTIRRHLPIPGKSQTDLVMGTFGPRRNSPDYLPASLGNNILGQFGMMGRIGDVVREQAGLAYSASTSLNAFSHGGTWEVSAGVNPTNLERAINLIMQELVRFVREGVTIEELEDSQSNYLGRLPLSLEANAGVAGALLNLERFKLGLDYYQRYPMLVAEVTPETILDTAQRYLDPEKLIIVSSGPDIVD
jgi:zinc protease